MAEHPLEFKRSFYLLSFLIKSSEALRCIDHVRAGETTPHQLCSFPLSLCLSQTRSIHSAPLFFIGLDPDVQSGPLCSFLTPHLH